MSMLLKRYKLWSILFILSLVLAFSFLISRPIMLTTGYPSETGKGILTMMVTPNEIVSVSPDSKKLLQEPGFPFNLFGSREVEPLTKYLEGYGWKWKVTMGSEILYEKNGVGLTVRRQQCRTYTIYTLDKTP